MERLTIRSKNSDMVWFKDAENGNAHLEPCEMTAHHNRMVLDKLATYEDAEEQGLLLRLPCKVGDTVYCIFIRYTKCTPNNKEFDEYDCQGCQQDECNSRIEKYIQDTRAFSLDWIVTNLKNFGKTVFLTREEAEAKLAEMQGGLKSVETGEIG